MRNVLALSFLALALTACGGSKGGSNATAPNGGTVTGTTTGCTTCALNTEIMRTYSRWGFYNQVVGMFSVMGNPTGVTGMSYYGPFELRGSLFLNGAPGLPDGDYKVTKVLNQGQIYYGWSRYLYSFRAELSNGTTTLSVNFGASQGMFYQTIVQGTGSSAASPGGASMALQGNIYIESINGIMCDSYRQRCSYPLY